MLRQDIWQKLWTSTADNGKGASYSIELMQELIDIMRVEDTARVVVNRETRSKWD